MAALENFRTNLRLAMDAKKISQRSLAASAKMSYPYVNRILQGKVEPSLTQCEKISETLGLSFQDLLDEPEVFEKRYLALR